MEKILDKILNVVDDDAVSVDEVVETKKHETDDKTKMFKSTFMAISNKFAEVGEHYKCYKISFCNNKTKLDGIQTSSIQHVAYLGNNIYQIATQNNLYIVLVNC